MSQDAKRKLKATLDGSESMDGSMSQERDERRADKETAAASSLSSDSRLPRTAHPEPHMTSPIPLAVDAKKYQIPIKIRTEALKKLLSECREEFQLAALESAIMKREKSLAMLSNKKTLYLSKIAAYLLELRKNIIPSLEATPAAVTKVVVLDEPTEPVLERYLLSAQAMEQLDFPTVAKLKAASQADEPVDGVAAVQCDRCHMDFCPAQYYLLAAPESCKCHDGRLLWPSKTSRAEKREKLYTCCSAPEGEPPCAHYAQHVYSVRRTEGLSQYILSPYYEAQNSELATRVIAMDCEMIYTSNGLELARLTAVDWDEAVVLDILVKPTAPVVDYNTRYSGISEATYIGQEFRNVVDRSAPAQLPYYTFEAARRLFYELLETHKTVLVGHSIENDLRVLKMIHPLVIDTSALFPHPKGNGWRVSLKNLASSYLNEFIQQGDVSGHSSLEDAVSSLRLFKYRLHKDRAQERAVPSAVSAVSK